MLDGVFRVDTYINEFAALAYEMNPAFMGNANIEPVDVNAQAVTITNKCAAPDLCGAGRIEDELYILRAQNQACRTCHRRSKAM